MTYEQIKYETKAGILTITLNRPDKLKRLHWQDAVGTPGAMDQCRPRR